MFDLYLFNTIINTVWYIFTILFVLYKFTSFFSYIYNFSRFCGKLFTGIHYVYTSIISRTANKYQPVDIESREKPKSIFERFKDTCKRKWNKLFGKEDIIPQYESVFPLVETTTLPNSYNAKLYQESNSILERQLFDQKMKELISEDSVYYDPNYQSMSLSDDKIKFSSNLLKSSLDKDEFDIPISVNTLDIISETMDELDQENLPLSNISIPFQSESESKSESCYYENNPLLSD